MSEQKKNVLVITGGDSSMDDVLNLTIKSKQKYTNEHGYDLLIKKSFQEFPELGFSRERMQTRYIGFSRIITALLMLEHYEVVMWVDGDAVITNSSIAIEDIINDTQTFYATYDWACSKDTPRGHHCFSTGNFIIQRTDRIGELYTKFYQASRLYLDDYGAEQSTLNYLYNVDDVLRSDFCILSHQFLNAVPESILETSVWMSDPKRSGSNKTMHIVDPWNSNSFLVHLTGCSNEDRVEQLNKHFSKYI